MVMTQITIVSVTLFLHRSQAHKAVEFHSLLNHFFRFWLWLTTGMVTKEWVAVHRRHHQKTDQPGDPHSPKVFGIWRVLLGGVFLYAKAAKDPAVLKLGVGTPDDWVEHNLYSKFPLAGIILMLAINLILFGPIGLLIWAIQMLWIPFWAAGVVNGIGHWWGYRNYRSYETSRNIFPIAVWIGGEELHNNHHRTPTSAKLSHRWWEIDIGWAFIKLFQWLGLAKLR